MKSFRKLYTRLIALWILRMVREWFVMFFSLPANIFIHEVDTIATARFDAQTGADQEVQQILMELLNQVSKLVDLYKGISEEWSQKAIELEGIIKALELPRQCV
ncbi:probable 26S protease regulatory subunit 10B isoform X2 [Sesamum indicum]|uniref:Probable 26S protease regulatory subunit 10B isoform X2 n=1 Tax=Sesamum indicum TaxID=4182 RepID=A0A8M8VFT6_SESIN|nr:probable 26S protease regulatory subunit 10B isoform X2 [Sesamum indicum]